MTFEVLSLGTGKLNNHSLAALTSDLFKVFGV